MGAGSGAFGGQEEATAAGSARRVLLIDDTPEVAELLTFSLRDHGYEVVAAAFADDINELAAEAGADALVLDCSAFDLSQSIFDALRSQSSTQASLPVVIISDTPERADASLRARQAERVLLIPKPFTGSQVARALDELLAAG